MAPELSSNWKKLQATIKEERSIPRAPKRKAADNEDTPLQTSKPTKKVRVSKDIARPSFRKITSRPPSAHLDKAKIPRKQTMGATQSQPSKPGISASLALWAEDNDISPESISEAYGLGSKNNSMLTATVVRINDGLAKNVEVGKYIALDCEMVGVGDRGSESALARVSIVDFHGQQIYDSYVRPKEKVVDWRTWVSGVSPKHMATARDFEHVQMEVARLFKGRIIVGHDLRHDLSALMLEHPRKDIRDTAKFSGFKKFGHGRKPGLRILAREILAVEIQNGEHSSIEDARVAMLLFRKYKSAFDVEHATRYPEPVPRAALPKPAAKQKKTKKKRRN
ncbi:unnamed protein product [Discula destructiva]